MFLDMDEGDIEEFTEENSKELSTEKLKEIQTQQQTEVLPKITEAEEAICKSTKCWEGGRNFMTIQKKHQKKIQLGVQQRYLKTFA